MRLYIGLIHFPVYNKNHDRIASAITTLDIHDLGRLARTYGVRGFFVVTPLTDQQELIERILGHWIRGLGGWYNPHRKEALELVRVTPDLHGAVEEVERTEGAAPVLIGTDASSQGQRSISYQEARYIVHGEDPVILLFGTAWGLHEDIMKETDHILDPVSCGTGYNHLSVRTAAAIILDRLVGEERDTGEGYERH